LRNEEYFNQEDKEDNLLSVEQLMEFVDINAKSDKPVMFNTDVKLFTVLNGEKFTLTAPEGQKVVSKDLKEHIKS